MIHVEVIAVLIASIVVIFASVGTILSARANRRRIEAANLSIRQVAAIVSSAAVAQHCDTIDRALRPPE